MKGFLALLFSLIIAFSNGGDRMNKLPPNEASEPFAEELSEDYDGFDEFENLDCDTEDGKSVICSVEAVNASLGYIVAPVRVEAEDGESCAQIFVDLLCGYGLDPIYSGTAEENFYLKRIGGLDTNDASVPATLADFLTNNKVKVTNNISEDGALGEFDLAEASGWIYTVNGEMPDAAMCDFIPEENDVIRLCFSLCYGADIARREDWGFEYGSLEIPYRDEITAAIAEAGADSCREYLDAAADFDTPQSELDAILKEILIR